MREGQAKRDIMSVEEATIANMWKVASIMEVLRRVM